MLPFAPRKYAAFAERKVTLLLDLLARAFLVAARRLAYTHAAFFLGGQIMARLVAILALLAAESAFAADEWTPLFNGKDLSGWETSLGMPPGGREPIGR